MAVISMKQLLEAGVHFGGALHLHRAQWHLHHRLAENRPQSRRGL